MPFLVDPLESVIRIDAGTRAALTRLEIKTVWDLLNHFPTRYADTAEFRSINSVAVGDQVIIHGTLAKIKIKKSFRSHSALCEATITDPSGTLGVLWFNQPYLGKMYPEGTTVSLAGKVTIHQKKLMLVNPDISKEKVLAIDSHDSLFGTNKADALQPVYPETKGISSRWLKHAIERVLRELGEVPDYLPEKIREKYNLPTLWSAFVWIHSPRTKNDATIARKRFAFEEIFLIQLARLKERAKLSQARAYEIAVNAPDLDRFIASFPFPLTKAQARAIAAIFKDLEKESPMSRLLEGDVGSGKTAVAAAAAFATVTNRPSTHGKKQTFGNLQVAYMAPTEILATQHFESFIEYFKGSGISIALITGSGCRKFPTKVASSRTPWTTISRTQLAKWIAAGEIPMVIGTHALIQKSLTFKHLALAIIDEQHRFGLRQRKNLAKKDAHFPHLLSMTATPIPRTLALTIYGDLDLSLLDELPPGRKPIITAIATPGEREKVYGAIRNELAQGRQLYVICPRIDEADPTLLTSLQVKSVQAEAKRLQKTIFPDFKIGTLHSKMSKEKKEGAMKAFSNHETDILVATSVVEVGVNVPNATMIIIEGAERFGLAQLHQLRGRVIRSNHQAYCYLFADVKTEKTKERLVLFTKAKNGFELAEYDLQLRGTGELTGAKQWGISDLGMDAIKNLKLVEAARLEAMHLLEKDSDLVAHPLLKEKVLRLESVHFE